MVLGGRAIRGGRVRPHAGLSHRYPGTRPRKIEEMSGKNSGAEAGAPIFFCVSVSRSPPPALEVTGDLDKEDRRVGGRGYDLGTGFAGCDGGIDERQRVEGFLASLSPPIFGKTEVTRELD
jgi:hypothetical protein